jgi:hypothetical protein
LGLQIDAGGTAEFRHESGGHEYTHAHSYHSTQSCYCSTSQLFLNPNSSSIAETRSTRTLRAHRHLQWWSSVMVLAWCVSLYRRYAKPSQPFRELSRMMNRQLSWCVYPPVCLGCRYCELVFVVKTFWQQQPGRKTFRDSGLPISLEWWLRSDFAKAYTTGLAAPFRQQQWMDPNWTELNIIRIALNQLFWQ